MQMRTLLIFPALTSATLGLSLLAPPEYLVPCPSTLLVLDFFASFARLLVEAGVSTLELLSKEPFDP